MGKFLEQVASPPVLNHAWQYVKNERGLWSSGIALPDMQRNLIQHIGELSTQLLAGTYHPEPMRCFEINKADGKKRLICSSMIRDKLVQRAILTVLEPLGEAIFHAGSFGFRPKCTLDMALSQVREWVRKEYVWLGDADIQGCFDNIPYEQTLKAVYTLCNDKPLGALVRASIESMPLIFRPAGTGRGLPQGMVLSPFLCNLHLHGLDIALANQKIPLVRFADDFIVFGQTQADAEKALAIAAKQLGKLGLKLHPDKTKVIRSSPNYQFLGKRLPDSKPRFQP